jgi:hypothetical protein
MWCNHLSTTCISKDTNGRRHTQRTVALPWSYRCLGHKRALLLVAQFGRVWYGLPTVSGTVPTPWLVLPRQAHAAVRSWYQQPGVACTLARLTHHLARAGTLDAQAWTALWQREYGQRLRQPAGITGC